MAAVVASTPAFSGKTLTSAAGCRTVRAGYRWVMYVIATFFRWRSTRDRGRCAVGVVLAGVLWGIWATGAAAADAGLADAAKARDWPRVAALIGAGADVDARQADGATALHWAAYWDEPGRAGGSGSGRRGRGCAERLRGGAVVGGLCESSPRRRRAAAGGRGRSQPRARVGRDAADAVRPHRRSPGGAGAARAWRGHRSHRAGAGADRADVGGGQPAAGGDPGAAGARRRGARADPDGAAVSRGPGSAARRARRARRGSMPAGSRRCCSRPGTETSSRRGRCWRRVVTRTIGGQTATAPWWWRR